VVPGGHAEQETQSRNHKSQGRTCHYSAVRLTRPDGRITPVNTNVPTATGRPPYAFSTTPAAQAAWPYLEVTTTRYRLLLLNASNTRRYRPALNPPPRQGPAFIQVGSDAGLLGRPIGHQELELAQAEPFDVVVDIFLHPDWYGRGLGADAIGALARYLFQQRGHHRLTIDPAAHNQRTIRCYQRVGFRPVGIMRCHERGPDAAGTTGC
jgi:GNAT superfamily N-acetyltransferase